MKNCGLHNEEVSTCTINARKQVETYPLKPHAIWPRSLDQNDTKGQQGLLDFISPLRESDLSFLWLLWALSSHNQHITARDLVRAEAI